VQRDQGRADLCALPAPAGRLQRDDTHSISGLFDIRTTNNKRGDRDRDRHRIKTWDQNDKAVLRPTSLGQAILCRGRRFEEAVLACLHARREKINECLTRLRLYGWRDCIAPQMRQTIKLPVPIVPEYKKQGGLGCPDQARGLANVPFGERYKSGVLLVHTASLKSGQGFIRRITRRKASR